MSGSLLLAAGIMASLCATPILALSYYYRKKVNAGREYDDRIAWPLWIGFSAFPLLFFIFVGALGSPSGQGEYVSNEFEMIEDVSSSQGVEVAKIKVSAYQELASKLIHEIKKSRPFAENYAITNATELVKISGVDVLKISLRYNAEIIGIAFFENRGGNIFGLVCARRSLAQVAANERKQCQDKLISGRSNQGTLSNG